MFPANWRQRFIMHFPDVKGDWSTYSWGVSLSLWPLSREDHSILVLHKAKHVSMQHKAYLFPNCFRSNVTISLNDHALGNSKFGLTIYFPNFLHILHSFTTFFIV